MTDERENQYQSAAWQKTVSRMTAAERASWAIETQLLARGIASMRLPRGAVVGVDDQPVSSLGFNGFQGPGSSLASGSFTTHAGTITELLRKVQLPVQAGKACATGRKQRAARIAEKMGYPVHVSPANSAKIHRLNVMVENRDELVAALKKIHDNTAGRTVLREANVTTAWIQKVPKGQRLRFLVVGSSAVAAVASPFGAGEDRHVEIEAVHPGIRELAVSALHAIPGLEHGEVYLAVEDVSVEPGAQDVKILSVAAEPDMDVYSRDGDCGLSVAGLVTAYYADLSGIEQGEIAEQGDTQTVFAGVVDTPRFARRLRGRVEKLLGPDTTYTVTETGEDEITMTLRGDLGCAAMLSTVGVRGLVKGLRASSSYTSVLQSPIAVKE